MNEKQAKKIRKDAIGLAAKMIESGRTIKTEREYKPQFAHSDTLVNRPDTLRGIYLYLKKNLKQQKNG